MKFITKNHKYDDIHPTFLNHLIYKYSSYDIQQILFWLFNNNKYPSINKRHPFDGTYYFDSSYPSYLRNKASRCSYDNATGVHIRYEEFILHCIYAKRWELIPLISKQVGGIYSIRFRLLLEYLEVDKMMYHIIYSESRFNWMSYNISVYYELILKYHNSLKNKHTRDSFDVYYDLSWGYGFMLDENILDINIYQIRKLNRTLKHNPHLIIKKPSEY